MGSDVNKSGRCKDEKDDLVVKIRRQTGQSASVYREPFGSGPPPEGGMSCVDEPNQETPLQGCPEMRQTSIQILSS